MEERDLIVIGAGSRASPSDPRRALRRARRRHRIRRRSAAPASIFGCVPKKAMWLASDLADSQRLAHEVGFANSAGRARLGRIRQPAAGLHRRHPRELSATLRGIRHRARRGARAFRERAHDHRGPREFTAPHIVIATGSSTRRPDLPGGARHRFRTDFSRSARNRGALRSSAAVMSASSSRGFSVRSDPTSPCSCAASSSCTASTTKRARSFRSR